MVALIEGRASRGRGVGALVRRPSRGPRAAGAPRRDRRGAHPEAFVGARGRPARASARDSAPRQEAQPSSVAPRVLVADDEPSVRMLLRVNLPLSGFEVVEAADGEAALARARAERFDLLVLDVMMPGLSGLEVAARLRSETETSGVPFVFVSARADEADVREGYAAGAADYITKPFDPLRLGERLRAVLDRPAGRPEDGAA